MAKGKVTIDIEVCKGCGLCIWACPKKILALDEHRINTAGYSPCHCIDTESCIACTNCAKVCPEVAITVEKND